MKHNRFFWILFVGIIFLGTVLRFYRLGVVPNGFQGDEAAYGYNAYSILKTGKDEYGKPFPLVLQSFNDYKPALYSYIDIPFIMVAGLTPFAVRFPSALFGVFAIIALYFFTKRLTGKGNIALLSAFLLAISPWHITFSRTTSEVVPAVFFLLVASYYLLELRKKFSWIPFILVLVCGTLSLLSYTAARFFVVIVAGLFFLSTVQFKNKKLTMKKGVLIAAILFVVIGLLYSLVASIARFEQINIFSDTTTKLLLDEQIREDQYTSPVVTRIFHNKIVNYGRTILKTYSDYLSLDYLALEGGWPARERIVDAGLFYIWEMPFILIGLYALFRKNKYVALFLLAGWLSLLFPSTLTSDDSPNMYRTLVTVPVIIIFISVGVYSLYEYFHIDRIRQILKVGIFIICGVVVLYELSYYLHQYYVHQDVHQPWYRDYASKALVAEIDKLAPHYSRIELTKSDTSYIFFLFYNKYDPAKYQAEGSPKDISFSGFDTYYFVPYDCPLNGGKNGTDSVLQNGKVGVLYVDKGSCVTPKYNTKLLKTVYWGDNSPAFKLLEFVSTASAKME